MHGMRIRLGVCLATLLLMGAVQARAFTLEQVLSPPFPSQLVAASQGARVAWVFNEQGARNVWVADGPDFSPRQVTQYHGDDGQPIAGLALTPDGATAVYARGTESNSGGNAANATHAAKAPKQQVWAIDVAAALAGKGAPRLLGDLGCPEEDCEDLEISPDGRSVLWSAHDKIWIAPVAGGTPARPLFEAQGTAAEPRWSPDGKSVCFSLGRKAHSFIGVYAVDGEAIRYLVPSTDRDLLPRWSPDGKSIAFIRQPAPAERLPLLPVRPRPWAIWVADPLSGAGHPVWQSTADMAGSLPLFMPDIFAFAAEGRILFSSEHTAGERNHLFAVAATGGAARALTSGEYDVETATLSADKRSVLFTANEHTSDPADEDRRHLWRVSMTAGTPVALTRGATIEWSPLETGDGKAVLCLGSTATTPALVYRIAANGRQQVAPHQLEGFPSADLVVPRQVIFTSADGLKIHGQLFMPRGSAGNHSRPAIIFTHGGPIRQMLLGFHYMDYYHQAYAMNEYLASHGYVVLSVNYRLGVMYGRAFRQADHGSFRGASEYQDVVAGAHFLATLPEVDARRVGLWGGSYGGFLTALGLARNSDLFAAGVDFHGVHDWGTILEGEGTLTGVPDAKQADEVAFASSPNSAVATWRSPVLLIQGDDDRNVPFRQMTGLVPLLRAQHVEFEQLVFPDEIHGFVRAASWLEAYRAMVDFLDRRLHPQAP